jgi:prophage regulatory protein
LKDFMTQTTTPATNVAIPQGNAQQTALWRLPKVLEHFPVSRAHWWAGCASGKFPKGIKVSDRVTVWRASDIHNLIASLK